MKIYLDQITSYFEEILHQNDQQRVDLKVQKQEIRKLKATVKELKQTIKADNKLIALLDVCPKCGCTEFLCGHRSSKGCSSER